MDKDNLVRTIEILCTALALTVAVGILAPAQDASARHTTPATHEPMHEIEQQLFLIEYDAVEL